MNVYDHIAPGDQPSQAYIDRGRIVINEQLVVAAYRLADWLADIYQDQNGVIETKLEDY